MELIIRSLRTNPKIKVSDYQHLLGAGGEGRGTSLTSAASDHQYPQPPYITRISNFGSDGGQGPTRGQVRQPATVHDLAPANCKDVQLALGLVKAQRDNISNP